MLPFIIYILAGLLPRASQALRVGLSQPALQMASNPHFPVGTDPFDLFGYPEDEVTPPSYAPPLPSYLYSLFPRQHLHANPGLPSYAEAMAPKSSKPFKRIVLNAVLERQASLYESVESCMMAFPAHYIGRRPLQVCTSLCFVEMPRRSVEVLVRSGMDSGVDDPGSASTSLEPPVEANESGTRQGVKIKTFKMTPRSNRVVLEGENPFTSSIVCPWRPLVYEVLEMAPPKTTLHNPEMDLHSSTRYKDHKLSLAPDTRFILHETLDVYLQARGKRYKVLGTLDVLSQVIANESPAARPGLWCHVEIESLDSREAALSEVVFRVKYSAIAKSVVPDASRNPTPRRRFRLPWSKRRSAALSSCDDVPQALREKKKELIVTCKLCSTSLMAHASVEMALTLASSNPSQNLMLDIPRVKNRSKWGVGRWIKGAVAGLVSKWRKKPVMRDVLDKRFQAWTRKCPVLALDHAYGGKDFLRVESAKVLTATFYPNYSNLVFFIDVLTTTDRADATQQSATESSAPPTFPSGIIRLHLVNSRAPSSFVKLGFVRLTNLPKIIIEGTQVRFAGCRRVKRLVNTPFVPE